MFVQKSCFSSQTASGFASCSVSNRCRSSTFGELPITTISFRSSSVTQHLVRLASSLRLHPVLRSRTTSGSMSNKLQLAANLLEQKTSATSNVSQLSSPSFQEEILLVFQWSVSLSVFTWLFFSDFVLNGKRRGLLGLWCSWIGSFDLGFFPITSFKNFLMILLLCLLGNPWLLFVWIFLCLCHLRSGLPTSSLLVFSSLGSMRVNRCSFSSMEV